MARPKKYAEHKIEAYVFFQRRRAKGEDVSALDIQSDLDESRPDGTASYRLIATWVREFKLRESRESLLDSPFRWYNMGACREYGLPWQASGFIMDMLAMIQGINAELATIKEELRLTPTLREVLWWWRVHQAAPEIATYVGILFDIYLLASAFLFRELSRELLAVPTDTADLEARLAVKPWLNERRHQQYHRLLDLKLVVPVQGWGEVSSALNVTSRLMPLEWVADHVIKLPEHPELLYSQQFPETVPIFLMEE